MSRLHYALPIDVVRRFNPQITRSNLEDWKSSPDAALVGYEDIDTITSRLEGIESKWDRKATPMRPVRIGSEAAPIYESAKGKGFPVNIYLDHMNIAPIDPNAGDFIERRTGRDSWTDITNREGSSWVADYREGTLTVYELPGYGNLPVLRNYRDRFIKLSYRLGAGGDYANAGETTLTASLASGDTSTVGVEHASRLPPSGGTMLVGSDEYIVVSEVDHGSGEIRVAERGVRRTEDVQHDAGTRVHYCPMDVREAIAAKTAEELVRSDGWTVDVADGDGSVDPERKIDDWEDEWTSTIAEYNDNYGYQ